VNNEHELK